MVGQNGRLVADISIAGLGHVGQALLGILAGDAEARAAFRVILVGDSSGCLAAAAGFAPGRLAALAEGKAGGASLAAMGALPGERLETGSGAFARALELKPPAIHVELGPTELATGGAAKDRIARALALGSRVASAAKGPFAAAWEELESAAGGREAFAARVRFSATVGAGLPILDSGRALALGSPIRGLAAALNGTSSLVLSLMEEGLSLEAAVARAQALGMAEADPSADLDGWDAAAKLVILARSALGRRLELEDVARESLRAATPERFQAARAKGARLRAIGRLTRCAPDGTGLAAAVALEEVPEGSPLAAPGGGAAVVFDCERTGEVSVAGRGAGPLETASAVYRDLRVLKGRD
ncbi:MAG: hypothetical protein JNG85_08575 [Spirochaetaceae bacterium]|nr:hypothetical protein [Spirochaetaceae bacterium]